MTNNLKAFNEKVASDENLQKQLVELTEKYKEEAQKDDLIADMIALAESVNIPLAKEDFDLPEELSENEMEAVAGGGVKGGCFISAAGCFITGEITSGGGCIVLGLYTD